MILHLLVVLSRAGHREKGCLLLTLPSFKLTTYLEGSNGREVEDVAWGEE